LGRIVGIDIGGTFTDVVVFDTDRGIFVERIKTLSTPRRPQRSVIDVLKKLSRFHRDIRIVIHATTIATNALLGQVGLELPKAALITTKGFRDVLEIGRQRRPSLYDPFFEKPKPLIPRRYRFEVNERVDGEGKILRRPSDNELRSLVEVIRKEHIVSVAICLINSYLNHENERYVKEFLGSNLDDVYICASYEVDDQYREYERMSTTAVNAILMPIVSRYLLELENMINQILPTTTFLIMKSDGGVSRPKFIVSRPATIIESGPAAGVIATEFICSLLGLSELLSFDMGGTTAKAGTIINGKPTITTEYEVGGKIHAGRIVKGSGYPIRYSFIDLAEVSSGGGSIIWVDEAGGLRVGPISAGSDPGPACYGRGGSKPTITDAHVVLGIIDDGFPLGGEIRVKRDLAWESLIKNVDIMDPVEVSIGAIKLANSTMAKILRIVTVERGLDPRDFVLVAFGGAGPMHACALADDLGIQKILIPIYPGLFSALGLIATKYKHVYYKSFMKTTSELEIDELLDSFRSLHRKALNDFNEIGIPSQRILISNFIDARYYGQGYELVVPIDLDKINDVGDIEKVFHDEHRRIYGYSIDEFDVEIVNVRVEAVGLLTQISLKKMNAYRQDPSQAMTGQREAYFGSIDDFEKAHIYRREKLVWGNIIEGPAIIESYDSTILVEPRWQGHVDEYGNIILMRR